MTYKQNLGEIRVPRISEIHGITNREIPKPERNIVRTIENPVKKK